ncbi:MAG: diguanylate cyclase [Alphaproteobacteria bacterium]|nr:diguanylate cyclase [Alphaproteobacteria bacterium]
MTVKSLCNFKYIFSTIRGSFVPAMFLLVILTFFFAQSPIADDTTILLHFLFWGVVGLCGVLQYLSNRSKPFFTLLVVAASYLIVNSLKILYGGVFTSRPEFQCLCFILPLTLVALHLMPQGKLIQIKNMYLLCGLLAEAVVFQYLSPLFAELPYMNITLENVPLAAYVVWAIVLVWVLINICMESSIIGTGLFYAYVCVLMSLTYATTAGGSVAFSFGAAVILLTAICADLYHRYHYDRLEFVHSQIAYLAHANSKFPFKYTIVIFSVDNRDKLVDVLGERKVEALEQMIIYKIRELPYEPIFYRYNKEELIMVFKNEDAKHTHEYAENIRRAVASSEFILAFGKKMKVTISACVSEKIRKDLNASEVIERAHNALHKNHRFNCNITTIA